MARPNIFKVVVAAVVVIVALGIVLPVFNVERITNSSVTIPVVITRNSQEVPPDQIRSVRYLFSGQLPQPASDIKLGTLREAHVVSDTTGSHWIWPVSLTFNITRTGTLWFGPTTVSPEVRSVFLRVEFADGRVFSLSFPVLSDRRESGAVFADFSDGPR